jgi:hypothetical protein
MRDLELEEDCPGLSKSTYAVKSPRDPNYNCIAFALGDLTHFWYDVNSPGITVRGYYWPPGLPSADTLEGWVKVFEIHGYSETTDVSLELEYEKVAIYATNEGPEHVARQRASGVWVSKMGKGVDIEHQTLEELEGEFFGKVVKIMRRRCVNGRRVLE